MPSSMIQPKRRGDPREGLALLNQSFESFKAFADSNFQVRNYASGFTDYSGLSYSEAMKETPFMEAVQEIMAKVIFQDGKIAIDPLTGNVSLTGDLGEQVVAKQHELVNFIGTKIAAYVANDVIEAMLSGETFTTAANTFTRPPGAQPLFDIRKGGNYGAFLEEGMLGALKHGTKPSPDEEKVGMEAKLITSGNVKPPLPGDSGTNYKMDSDMKVGGAQVVYTGITGNRTLTWEELSDPMIRVTVTLMKMIRKMNNLLFVSIYEKSYSGGMVAELSFRAIILFTELYIRKLIDLITKSMTVKARQGLPKYLSNTAYVNWDISINFNEGSLLAGISTLTQLYLSHVGIMANSTFDGGDEFRNALFGFLRKLTGWASMPESGLNT